MIEKDTVRLLRECDAGIKMGVSSIDDVLDNVKAQNMRDCLKTSKCRHLELQGEVDSLLRNYCDEGKQPSPLTLGMSWIKTNVSLAVDSSDSTVAELMTDGCNMGVKSLSRYLNQYAAADEKSKDICKKLIRIEEQLSVDMRDYL